MKLLSLARWAGPTASIAFALALCGAAAADAPPAPNFVLIVADDLGYGDLGCYGNTVHRTPHLDQLAADGVRFTDFYMTSSVCTPSRVALLTGRYPSRAGLTALLWPADDTGLPAEEITLAGALHAAGYATHLSGKWHLGHKPAYLPHRRGFDSWFGMPYPNDFDGRHPRSVALKLNWPPLLLLRDDAVVEQPTDVNLLTEHYTADAEHFIEANRDRPFFLYLAQAMPHTWLGASAAFRGRSRNGQFGDAVEELDASVGRIHRTLARFGLTDRTVIVFTNDNGAAVRPPETDARALAEWRTLHPDDSRGTNAPLRGGKQDAWEGGVRVPAIVTVPGGLKGSVTRAPASALDLLPTLLALAHAPPPADRTLDGRSLVAVLRGTGARDETDLFFGSDPLLAVRAGKWKLVARRSIRLVDLRAPPVDELYDLSRDPGESRNVASDNPEIVDRLRGKLAAAQQEFTAEAERRGYRSAAKPR